MTQQALFDAINQTNVDIGMVNPVKVTHPFHAPMAMTNLAAGMWVRNFPENDNTRLIREQMQHLWFKGALKFDD